MNKYSTNLLDPRWQKKRLEILDRDDFTCQSCGRSDKTLHVHHRYYVSNRMPWEYPDFCFVTLCVDCHAQKKTDLQSLRGTSITIWDEWEVGLNHFGDRIFDMAAVEQEAIA